MTKLDEYYEFVSRRNYPKNQIWVKWGVKGSSAYESQGIYLDKLVARYVRGEELGLHGSLAMVEFLSQYDMPLAVAALGEGYFE